MDLIPNQFKRGLAGGQLQTGFWLSLASATATEALAGAGYDWLLIDGEHSPIGTESALAMLHAASGYPVAAVVRPSANDAVMIKRLLDIGAQTLLVPFVNTADEARAAVAAMRYPPNGVRGFGGATVRATRFGRVADYATRCEEELCLLVQAETRRSIEDVEAIAAIEGVEGVFIGPADLAADMGYPGKPGHPEVIQAIEGAIARVVKQGKACGVLTMDPAFARRCVELGCTFVAIGVDVVMLARGSERALADFRQGIPG